MADTANRFMIAAQGSYIRILLPIPSMLDKNDALNLAAWLVALADDEDEFAALLEAVRDT